MKKFVKIIALALSIILLVQSAPLGNILAADKVAVSQFTAHKSASEGVPISSPAGESFLTAEQAAAAGTSEPTIKDTLNREPTPILGEVEELRSENTKYFRHQDGTYTAAMYAEPVHYKDAEGKYKDTDYTLELNSKKLSTANKATYTPAASGLDVRIPQDFANGQQLTVSKEGHTVGMGVTAQNNGVAELSAVKAEVKNGLGDEPRDTTDTIKDNKIEADNAKLMELKKRSSSVTYKDIFPGADLEYIITSGRIKESIFVKEAQKEYTYQFSLSLNGLIPVPQEDGSILLYVSIEDESPLLILEAPYMYDAAGEECTALKMILSKDGILTLTADAAWINDEGRAFPVIIDPTLVVQRSSIDDAYISTAAMNTTYRAPAYNFAGTGTYDTRRTYMSFNLPTLPASSVVVGAQLEIKQDACVFYNAGNYLLAYDLTGMPSWSPTNVTWNNQPVSGDINGPRNTGVKAADYNTVNNNSYIWYDFNITKTVKNWYENDNNNGIMFTTYNESVNTISRLYTVRHSTITNNPAVEIEYITNLGLEEYWSYETIDMGRSGTAYANDYSGSLTYIHSDMAMTGNLLPINISHVYNSDIDGVFSTGYNGMNVGDKFHLNLQELLLTISQPDPLYDQGYRYKLYDGDGTLHYFKLNTETGDVTHEFDTSLVVISEGNNLRITDGQDNKKYYNSAGRLFKIVDNNDNFQLFTFSGNRITRVTDTLGRYATLSYNAYNQLTAITDPAGRSTTFNYAGTDPAATLSNITYQDGKSTSFLYLYLGFNMLHLVTTYDNSSNRFWYNSTAGCGNRIYYIYQYDKVGTMVDYLRFLYTQTNASGQATGNTLVTNKINKTNTYLFDGYGRTISITNQDGQSQYALYGLDTSSTATRNQFNKNIKNSEQQTVAKNLVKNHGFEQTVYWSVLQTTEDGSYGYDTDEHSGGNRSMMMELTGNTGIFEVGQDFTATAGETYTVTIDIKIPQDLTLTGNNGVMFGFAYDVNGVWQTDGSEWIAATTGNEWLDPELRRGWQRFTHTMTLPSGTTDCRVFIELARTPGAAYFDNIQVEKSGGARNYNLVENSDFSNAPGTPPYSPGTTAYGWTMSGTQAGDGVQYINGRNYLLMTGSPDYEKKISQTVSVNADVGDVLIIGGKAAAYATIDTDNNRKFGIIAEIYDTDTTKVATIPIDFDRTINMEYQIKATSYTLTTPCHHVDYTFVYYRHMDGVTFTDAFIYVGNFGEHNEYNDAGQLVEVVNDENNKSINYTYDVDNDLATINQTISGTDCSITSFEYDTHNVSQIANNSGTEISFEYNDNGQVTSQTITEENPGNNPLTRTESMTYIQEGRHIKTFTDINGGVTTYTYDNNDQALKGLVVKVEDPEGNETTYTYDPNTDELLSTTGYANPSTPSTTNFTSQDYLPKTVTRNNTSYSYDYDNQNRVTAAKVGNQALITNTYDSRQRLSQQSYANQTVYTPVYDSRDRLDGDKWNNVQTTKYYYNENDRLSQFVDNTTGTTYKYDYAFYGLVNRVDGSDGTKTAYDYDATGQLSHLMFSKNNDIIYKARYQTNEKGNPEDVILTSLGEENATLLHYNYDGLNRLTGNSCGPLITERTYCAGTGTNGTSDLIEEYTNKNDAGILQQYEYEYDLNGNITEITETQAAETTTYTYDGLNRLIGEISPNNSYVYNYDVGGNLTTITNNGSPVHSYVYDNSNWKDQLTSIDNNAIAYDASGNPLSYNGFTFTWQRGRQLTAFSGNGQNISYTYDAQGHRIQQIVNGTTITYTYSDDLLMRQSIGANSLDFQYDAGGITAGFNW